jgi:hypothetical protein
VNHTVKYCSVIGMLYQGVSQKKIVFSVERKLGKFF